MPSTSDAEWVAWRLTLPEPAAEAAVGVLLEISPHGFVDEPAAPGSRRFTVYVAAGVWAEHGPGYQRRLERLASEHGVSIQQQLQRQQEEDWWALSRRFFHAFPVGSRLRIRPPWEPAGGGDRREIIIDPGRSFGTGLHETTRLCLQLMETYLHPGQKVLDLGTGTGILALAAAALGSGPVLALDVDPHAVEAARRNTALNGQAHRIHAAEGTLPLQRWGPFTPGPPYGLVVANIIRQVLEPMGGQLHPVMAPGAHLIASGLLGSALEPMRAAYRAAGLNLVDRRREGEWLALVFQRPADP